MKQDDFFKNASREIEGFQSRFIRRNIKWVLLVAVFGVLLFLGLVWGVVAILQNAGVI